MVTATEDSEKASWAEALQAERKKATDNIQMQVMMAIRNSPQAFGLSRAELKRMDGTDLRRMANGIAEALENKTGLILVQRPSITDQQFDPFFWWKQTWNHFRALGHKSSMIFSRDLYVALTRYPFHDFTDMDENVEFDPPPKGLRIVK